MNRDTYQFPTDQQIIIKALNTVNSDPWLNERIFPYIAGKFAGVTLIKSGVSLKWQMACYDVFKADETPYQAQVVFSMEDDEYIAALLACATFVAES